MTHKHRILVVEDDLGIRQLLTARLKDADVTFATCQSEAYEQLRTSEFDLVLLDLRLPTKPGDMKATNQVGIDILRQIRTQGLTKRGSAMLLPVVVMTAYGSETLSADVLVGTGANDYIPKPFGAEGTLEHKIRVALAGEGALVPASNIVGSTIRIAFSTAQEVVCIETFEYSGAHYGLLKVLGDLYVEDLQNLSSEENFTRLPGGRLAVSVPRTRRGAMPRSLVDAAGSVAEGEGAVGVGGELGLNVFARDSGGPVDGSEVEDLVLGPARQQAHEVAEVGPGLDADHAAAGEQRGEGALTWPPSSLPRNIQFLRPTACRRSSRSEMLLSSGRRPSCRKRCRPFLWFRA